MGVRQDLLAKRMCSGCGQRLQSHVNQVELMLCIACRHIHPSNLHRLQSKRKLDGVRCAAVKA